MQETERKRLGVVVNPLAGIGGRAGLKGSDGPEIQRLARERGGEPAAPRRALEALRAMGPGLRQVRVITCPGPMGEDLCRAAGLRPEVLPLALGEPTGPEDTEAAARMLRDMGADLLLFAGGDGTARNICAAVGTAVPAVGVPGGVKLQSAVFARTPRCAGLLAGAYLEGRAALREREVVDLDEEAYRAGRVEARLYGCLSVPFTPELVQRRKAASRSEDAALRGIASEIAERMEDGCWYILGAGTTTRAVTDLLGLEKTLLGVDVVHQGALAARDLSERELLALLEGRRAKLVVAPTGGQGYLFGRGNQQLSGRVLRAVGPENIIVVAPLQKIADLNGAPLWIDLDDGAAARRFPGYLRVVTGYRQELAYPVRTETQDDGQASAR